MKRAALLRTTPMVTRSELARTTPLARTGGLSRSARTSLTASSAGRRRKGLAPRSKKMAALYKAERVPLVGRLLDERPWCEIRWDGNCRGRSEGLHEVESRGRGGSITDEANVLAACHYCNGAVSDNPVEAEGRGFLLPSGRPSKATPRRSVTA